MGPGLVGLLGAVAIPSQALVALFCWLRIMQVLFIFPSSGPLLLMCLRMLEDLVQFLTLAAFVVVAFGCAFFVLFCAAYARNQPTHPHILSIPTVISLLVEGALDGESAHIIDSIQGGAFELSEYGKSSTFAWLLMTVFGVVVVLLLLNLLIARFAKTFDMVYENLDANSKLAFARVVIEGHNKHLLPPPLNLLRSLILALYSVGHSILNCVRGYVCSCRGGRCDGLSTVRCSGAIPAALSMVQEALHTWFPCLRSCASSSTATPPGYSSLAELDAEEMEEAEAARHVAKFLRKATNAQVRLLPDAVETYVVRHQHDVAREERWRTAMQKELSAVSQQLKELQAAEEQRAVQQLDLLEHLKMLGMATQSLPGASARRPQMERSRSVG